MSGINPKSSTGTASKEFRFDMVAATTWSGPSRERNKSITPTSAIRQPSPQPDATQVPSLDTSHMAGSMENTARIRRSWSALLQGKCVMKRLEACSGLEEHVLLKRMLHGSQSQFYRMQRAATSKATPCTIGSYGKVRDMGFGRRRRSRKVEMVQADGFRTCMCGFLRIFGVSCKGHKSGITVLQANFESGFRNLDAPRLLCTRRVSLHLVSPAAYPFLRRWITRWIMTHTWALSTGNLRFGRVRLS